MRIVPVTDRSAEVHVGAGNAQQRIGDIGAVGAVGAHWWWRHRDGERSSAVAASRLEAAQALAEYDLAFKQPVRRAESVRRRWSDRWNARFPRSSRPDE